MVSGAEASSLAKRRDTAGRMKFMEGMQYAIYLVVKSGEVGHVCWLLTPMP